MAQRDTHAQLQTKALNLPVFLFYSNCCCLAVPAGEFSQTKQCVAYCSCPIQVWSHAGSVNQPAVVWVLGKSSQHAGHLCWGCSCEHTSQFRRWVSGAVGVGVCKTALNKAFLGELSWEAWQTMQLSTSDCGLKTLSSATVVKEEIQDFLKIQDIMPGFPGYRFMRPKDCEIQVDLKPHYSLKNWL